MVVKMFLNAKFVRNFRSAELRHVTDVSHMPASKGVLNYIKLLRDMFITLVFLWTCHYVKTWNMSFKKCMSLKTPLDDSIRLTSLTCLS